MGMTRIPEIGLGTRVTKNDDAATYDNVNQALELGYRFFDTAQKYGNETGVGDAIAQSHVSRDDIFLATKVAETNLAHSDVLRTTGTSRSRLGVDVIDLLYIHWPAVSGPDDRYDPRETIPAFNELIRNGDIRHVGVANFSTELLDEARRFFDVPILANQVEMHPLLQQDELLRYARKHDMYLVAYCPLMRGAIGDVPELQRIADEYGNTPAQVSLAWLMAKDNVIPIPGARGDHLIENFRARDLELKPRDLRMIDNIDREERVLDIPKGPWNW